MEAVEEAVAVSPQVRRQRSKRPRHATSTSSAEVSGRTTEEEEDMANCLMLLAQGGAGGKVSGRRPAEAATTGDGRAGLCVYECKTCSKRFPSFQALGGHRASHKKIKPAVGRLREAAIEEETIQLSMNSFSAAEVGGGGRARVHECSMCGAEFSSGQALGGHMRRHRPVSHPEVKKERSGLSLDLNLPAPSDDTAVGGQFPKSPSSASTSAFPFAAKPTLLFSSSALVDCHY